MVAGKYETAFWRTMMVIDHPIVVLQGSEPVLGRIHTSGVDEVVQKEV